MRNKQPQKYFVGAAVLFFFSLGGVLYRKLNNDPCSVKELENGETKLQRSENKIETKYKAFLQFVTPDCWVRYRRRSHSFSKISRVRFWKDKTKTKNHYEKQRETFLGPLCKRKLLSLPWKKKELLQNSKKKYFLLHNPSSIILGGLFFLCNSFFYFLVFFRNFESFRCSARMVKIQRVWFF